MMRRRRTKERINEEDTEVACDQCNPHTAETALLMQTLETDFLFSIHSANLSYLKVLNLMTLTPPECTPLHA